MTKTKEEIVAEFEEIFNRLDSAEKAFVTALILGEGVDEAADALLAERGIDVEEEEGWGEPYGPLVICTDEGCPCEK